MTLQTSFFNKGIYKSSVRRYLWGSVLYFVILFLSTPLNMLMSFNPEREYSLLMMDSYKNLPLILRSQYFTFPILMAIGVSVVTALLVFRFVHSKKAAIFTHSIPVTRCGNYISSLLAAFTLMFVPVILNGLILMIISVCGFYDFYSIKDCFVWMGINIFAIFTIFSVATFSSMITGNTFAVIVLNIVIHSFLFITVGTFFTIGELFLCGYDASNAVFETILKNNFVCAPFSMSVSDEFMVNFGAFKYLEFILISVIIYILSLFIYKKRNLENAEDVAGFKFLNHIFKYFATFIITSGAFALFANNIKTKPVSFIFLIVIISIITYFACEMILKKNLKVFGAYKGYIGFALIYSLLICVFAFTNFFGYETFVPDYNDVKSVSVYNYYYNYEKPVTEDEDLIKAAINYHKEHTSKQNIYFMPPEIIDNTKVHIHIEYTLNNGKVINRAYVTNMEKSDNLMNEFYKNDSYKMQCEDIFIPENSVTAITLYGRDLSDGISQTVKDSIKLESKYFEEFVKVIQSDVLSLDYKTLHPQIENPTRHFGVEIRYNYDKPEIDRNVNTIQRGVYISINDNYKNTIEWVTKKGQSLF